MKINEIKNFNKKLKKKLGCGELNPGQRRDRPLYLPLYYSRLLKFNLIARIIKINEIYVNIFKNFGFLQKLFFNDKIDF